MLINCCRKEVDMESEYKRLQEAFKQGYVCTIDTSTLCISPISWIDVMKNKELLDWIRWVNRNICLNIASDMYKTTDVKIRIATNMLNKIESLTDLEKIQIHTNFIINVHKEQNALVEESLPFLNMTISPKITPEEIELIKRAKAGSEPAFTQLFKRYKNFVDNLLYSYIKDKDEARDITNVVFLKVHEKLSKFTDYSTFGGWLRILTKNVAIDYLRTIKIQNTHSEETLSNSRSDQELEDTEKMYTDKMTCEKIYELFDILPPSYREVCRLFYMENMTVAQISEALNVPKGTIKSDLHRMRKIFKNNLKL